METPQRIYGENGENSSKPTTNSRAGGAGVSHSFKMPDLDDEIDNNRPDYRNESAVGSVIEHQSNLNTTNQQTRPGSAIAYNNMENSNEVTRGQTRPGSAIGYTNGDTAIESTPKRQGRTSILASHDNDNKNYGNKQENKNELFVNTVDDRHNHSEISNKKDNSGVKGGNVDRRTSQQSSTPINFNGKQDFKSGSLTLDDDKDYGEQRHGSPDQRFKAGSLMSVDDEKDSSQHETQQRNQSKAGSLIGTSGAQNQEMYRQNEKTGQPDSNKRRLINNGIREVDAFGQAVQYQYEEGEDPRNANTTENQANTQGGQIAIRGVNNKEGSSNQEQNQSTIDPRQQASVAGGQAHKRRDSDGKNKVIGAGSNDQQRELRSEGNNKPKAERRRQGVPEGTIGNGTTGVKQVFNAGELKGDKDITEDTGLWRSGSLEEDQDSFTMRKGVKISQEDFVIMEQDVEEDEIEYRGQKRASRADGLSQKGNTLPTVENEE